MYDDRLPVKAVRYSFTVRDSHSLSAGLPAHSPFPSRNSDGKLLFLGSTMCEAPIEECVCATDNGRLMGGAAVSPFLLKMVFIDYAPIYGIHVHFKRLSASRYRRLLIVRIDNPED